MDPTKAFVEHRRIISSALSLCHKVYEGAMGDKTPPKDSRVARDPLSVLEDMNEILKAAGARIGEIHRDSQ